MNKVSIIKDRGFTIVETLVAIAILMISVAGPLTIANQALKTAVGARNVMMASFLAQDAMEYLKNLKDNNLANDGLPWLTGISESGSCTSSEPCVIWTAQNIDSDDVYENLVTPCGSVPVTGCRLSIDDGGVATGYIYGDGYRQTPFTRYYFLTDATANEKLLTVVVAWNTGTIENTIQLQELLSQTPR